MGKIKDLTGQRFGRLTVIGFAGFAKNRNAMWDCKCDCGRICTVKGGKLTSGSTKSCGCLRAELRTKLNTVHHMCGTKIYSSWRCMLTRCLNPNHETYSKYGGRGITVCDEWKNSFQAFFDFVSKLEHFGEDGYTLDRINNDGNYEPGNVKWSTAKEQARNRRDTVFVEYAGKKMALAEAAEQAKIEYKLALSYYYNGRHGEKIFKPVAR